MQSLYAREIIALTRRAIFPGFKDSPAISTAPHISDNPAGAQAVVTPVHNAAKKSFIFDQVILFLKMLQYRYTLFQRQPNCLSQLFSYP